MKHEWKGRVAFAELAEAIGCDSDEIMGAQPRRDGQLWTVIYTVNTDTLDPTVWGAQLERDGDGILRMINQHGLGSWNQMAAEIEAEIRRRLPEQD